MTDQLITELHVYQSDYELVSAPNKEDATLVLKEVTGCDPPEVPAEEYWVRLADEREITLGEECEHCGSTTTKTKTCLEWVAERGRDLLGIEE